MLTRNLIGGLVAMALGLAYLAVALQIQVSMLADTFGPRGMPLIYGGLMTGLGALLTLEALLTSYRLDPEARARLHDKEWRGMGVQILRAAGMFAIAAAYVLLVSWLGYPISLALLILAVALYMGARPGPRLLLIGVAGALAMWAIFVGLLGVRMPEGFLGALF
ncbi:tripartite tricarboxylate transporter TctB family protein [Cereibacter johrii]|uniref:tripartite tricarboxylate transporter TctB family protein n=1 Tax=Cereibacter johrii TaxID=445629 RepID=UPI000C6EC932|nr:tripartite tricarboxylate transporter TctB family protein [Cereibacter johrii]MEA5160239.1 tripartite tricarboxylate transporter TctB family protein [Cereibacter johrii]QCP87705.1 tripartite tricarboxylate transporter TctB family protein [Cereibacter sphaeroides]RAZ85230.1 tripartite tricarboxylate transporter TctB family protein [Cereibacter johrii]RDS95314.1 tripartite tricarboxylate transporter TctB family protein [Cereibacter sphaeroides f. sp. denitrificans]